MNSSLSGSTYILRIAKSSIDTYTLSKLSNTQRELLCRFGHTIKKAFLAEEFVLFHFLKILDQLVDKNAFENDLVS